VTLFDEGLDPARPGAPLAVRMRPRAVDDVVGQDRALAEGAPLRTLLGGAQGAAAHQTDMLSQLINQVSGSVEMRISNSEDMSGAVWEKVTPTKSWTLACNPGEACIVYAQFKDAAQNVSLIVNDAVELDATAGTAQIFLPLINR